jgi:hypothetical protein
MEVLPGFYQEVFHERDRALPIARAAGFIARAFEVDPPIASEPEPVGRAGATANQVTLAAILLSLV